MDNIKDEVIAWIIGSTVAVSVALIIFLYYRGF